MIYIYIYIYQKGRSNRTFGPVIRTGQSKTLRSLGAGAWEGAADTQEGGACLPQEMTGADDLFELLVQTNGSNDQFE